ncbi:carbohydrate ABC transporter permease [Actinosynnema pretiosum subsp. pretiosum]|uniref:Carbohydrate ABC transporter permease n=1 Tax=Actinosynnema pretiosum subsp. pretiosum TaxID=103721 RepID=A0AA45L7I8_9PSEU|nr:carbohydrate ABC transporter permease [Actinosynnema mirum]AXX30839.1 ABC sugar transporter, inner membrane subunit [Actinosynnema pretiosum subsp. pretiosum]QUF05049.1 carbohydrate ABC transporter permease [Actinosynnema pretiosum subsp. pretiosum]
MSARRSGARRSSHPVAAVFLVAVAVVVLSPLAFAVVASLRTDAEVAADPLGWPSTPAWGNYGRAAEAMGYGRAVLNTLVVTGGAAVLTVLAGSLCAWALTRHVRRWTGALYQVFVAGLTVPVFVVLTPVYLLLRDLGLINTHLGAVLAHAALNLPFAVFFYCGFLRAVPVELEEAAVLDGCSTPRLFTAVVFPLLRPATATMAVFVVLAVWNDLIVSMLVLDDETLRPVTPAAYALVGPYGFEPSTLFPAVVLAAAPLVAVFLALQRHIVAGITAGAGR